MILIFYSIQQKTIIAGIFYQGASINYEDKPRGGGNKKLKVHIIIHHYIQYFEITGTNLKLTNGEFTESCYST